MVDTEKPLLTVQDHMTILSKHGEAAGCRDRLDRTRADSPLGVPDGARVIDTGAHTVEEIVDQVVTWL